MTRKLLNALCLTTIALGAGFLAAEAQDATSPYPRYDRCMYWCLASGEAFEPCHLICRVYLEGPPQTEEPSEPVGN